VNQQIYSYRPFLEWGLLQHLQGCSVCGPALKILDEVPAVTHIQWIPGRLLWPWKNARFLEEPWKSLINLYLLTAPCFWLTISFDWSRWVAISSLIPICSPNFSFMGGVGKK
jgi:hypothetical protein